MPKEPQSYGSQGDWVRGEVGEEIGRQKSEPAPEHADFYAPRRESERSAPRQGGETPAEQVTDQPSALDSCETADEESEGARRVADIPGGARRNGFFKERDYRR